MAKTIKDKVKEFNQMAKLINKNLSKLAKEMPESRALERYRGEFQPITSKNPNKQVVNKLYKSAKNVLKMGVTDIDSERRSVALAIDTLKRSGIDYVNKRNFKSFFNFLDDARARGLGALYSSTQLIEAFKEAKDKGLSKKEIMANIDYWSSKNIKYDDEGMIIEPDEYKPLKVIKGTRLDRYMDKIKDRIKKEAKGDY